MSTYYIVVHFFHFSYVIYDFIDFILYSLLVLLVIIIMILLCYLISLKNLYFEKTSAYECGFDPFSDAREKFHINFYIIAILFIIFDIELIYFLP